MNFQTLILVGNVTKDAQLKTSKDGKVDYAYFRVAVSGNKEGKTMFFPITLFGERAKKLAQYITKGRQVLIEGRIEVSQTGHYSVIANAIEFGTSAKREEIGEASAGETDSVE